MSEEEIIKECNQLFVTMLNCHINGKPMADLLALYEQEKEKNKELEKENIDIKEKSRQIAENLNCYIHKDKLKEKIDELMCKERTSKIEMGNLYRYGIAVLNSVLEEK